MKRLTHSMLALATLTAATAAAATPLNYTADFNSGIGPEWNVPASSTGVAGIIGRLPGGVLTLSGSVPLAGTVTGSFSFDLLGFNSIDGAGTRYADTFRMQLNGTEFFNANFDLGGGGTNQINLAPAGTTVSKSQSVAHITFNFVDAPLASGLNTLSFSYGGLEGLSNESWGIDNVRMTGDFITAVPEPATAASLLAGLALLAGFSSRARRR